MKYNIGDKTVEYVSFAYEDVLKYAALSGDTNPLHVDKEYAQKNRFGEIIVHGMLASSVFSKILGTKMPGNGCIYLEQMLIFKKPVYIDTPLSARVEIVDITEKGKKKIIDLKTDLLDDTGQYLICGTAKVLVE